MAYLTLTPEKRAQFLSLLAECGNVTRAADEAGLSRVYLYQMRRDDEAFAAEWETAADIGAKRLEDEARRRAVDGWQDPVWHQGQQVGTVRKYSDTLLICLLKAHHPEKYADRQKSETNLTGDMTVQGSVSLDPSLAAAISHLLPHLPELPK